MSHSSIVKPEIINGANSMHLYPIRPGFDDHISNHSARFSLALLIAICVHLFLIFSISFVAPEKKKNKSPQALDVVLMKQSTEAPPEEADYLAQVEQKGGGEREKKNKPKTINPGKTPQKGNASSNQPILVPKKSAPPVVKKSVLATKKVVPKKAPKLQKKQKPKVTKQKLINSDYLSQLKKQIIDLEADLDYETDIYTKRTKHKYLNASTAKAVDAEYVRQWTRKIERIGNLNYPNQAKRDKLSGTLILSVTLNPKGRVINITIRSSSGHKILDDAAMRIVRLAAPFAPIPKNVLQNNNALVITRTWLFTQKSNGQFRMN